MNSLKLRLDPWAIEYNTAYNAEDIPFEEKENIDTTLEFKDWQAVTPISNPKKPFQKLLFTDGTRRLDARVLLEDEKKQVAFGAIGTFGIGVVDCCAEGSRKAIYTDLDDLGILSINRICALSNGRTLQDFNILPHLKSQLGTLNYSITTTDKRDADSVARQIQFEMLKAEGILVSRLTDEYPDALIITDGPLPRIGFVRNVVGYVKTIHQISITELQMEVVRSLEEGQRSPIYLVTGQDKSQQRFEWFLRLRDPNPWLYSLAGMVRLQAYAGNKAEDRFEEIQNLANWLAVILPRFSSKQYQDPRAPQQLLPIRALENELRRYMGNPQIIRRRIIQHLQDNTI